MKSTLLTFGGGKSVRVWEAGKMDFIGEWTEMEMLNFGREIAKKFGKYDT